MIRRYERPPRDRHVGENWRTFAYDDQRQEITLYDIRGSEIRTYYASLADMAAWIAEDGGQHRLTRIVDADLELDEGL